MTTRQAEVSIERYLTYLDKEMTIMGILSAFCMAVLALGIKLWSSQESARVDTLVAAGRVSLPIAAIMMLLAALAFYRQRSLLAWYYGQLSLAHSGYDTHRDLYQWLQDADGWDTWVNYRCGFWMLTGTFCELAIAGVAATLKDPRAGHGADAWGGLSLAVVLCSAALAQKLILERWTQAENPYTKFRKDPFALFKRH